VKYEKCGLEEISKKYNKCGDVFALQNPRGKDNRYFDAPLLKYPNVLR